jgi:hypothetical protein
MSKPKNKKQPELKVYRISETVYVHYEVVAISEEDATNKYTNLPTEEFKQLLEDGASDNFHDYEVTNEEEYVEGENIFVDITDAAKEVINKRKK